MASQAVPNHLPLTRAEAHARLLILAALLS